ncbi:MAG TPA: hypothetical protein VGD81_02255 [Opitutaceae bacterium]
MAVVLALLSLVPLIAGCGRNRSAPVELQVRAPAAPDSTRLEIRAHVAAKGALNYRWFSTHGNCEPQESTEPFTIFTFGPGTASDEVSLEVWLAGKRIGIGRVAVQSTARARQAPDIVFTVVPPYDAERRLRGRQHIAGMISGEVAPGWVVVVYRRNERGIWIIQPSITDRGGLHADGTWAATTNSGTNYAVLLVDADYIPPDYVGALPAVGEGVISRAIAFEARSAIPAPRVSAAATPGSGR